MENLKCTTSNCEFHFKNRCTAGVINVNEKGVCKTRQKRVGGAYAQAIAEFELADELTPLAETNTEVQCNCENCIHNEDKMCSANTILVGDGIMNVKCFSKHRS
ncbi:MAG: DUF1540 domain-containing protein [Clostridia bacterium]|nr:DUF1540 domain-containing protein [Clostridia bacterium]